MSGTSDSSTCRAGERTVQNRATRVV